MHIRAPLARAREQTKAEMAPRLAVVSPSDTRCGWVAAVMQRYKFRRPGPRETPEAPTRLQAAVYVADMDVDAIAIGGLLLRTV